MPEGHEHLSDDEKHLAKLGYVQELSRSWSGFSNFAISFSIISILAGCFTSFGLGWNNGGPAAIAWGWPLVSVFILIIGLCMSELVSAYPTSGGIYWWASKLGGAKAGFYTGWLNLIGLIAILASVAYGCATFLDLTLGTFSESWLAGYSLTRTFILFVIILAVVGDHQHLLQPPAGRHQQRLGVVARGGRRGGGPDPDRRSPSSTPVSPMFSPQTINNSGMFGGDKGFGWLLFVLPIAAILTQYTITGYDASAHLSEETKSAADGAAKGIWRSIFYSAIGGWILLLTFLFAVQDSDGVSEGRRRGGDDLRPGDELQVGRHRPVHLDRGTVLLHDGLPDQRIAHAVRVQPRPRGARPPAVVRAQHRTRSPPTVSSSPRLSRRSSRCPHWSRWTSTAPRSRWRSSRWCRSALSGCTCASRSRSTTGGRPAIRSRWALGT